MSRDRRWWGWVAPVAALLVLVAVPGLVSTRGVSAPPPTATIQADKTQLMLARQRIKHVVFVIKENRSFDSMFGAFPGVVRQSHRRVGSSARFRRGLERRGPVRAVGLERFQDLFLAQSGLDRDLRGARRTREPLRERTDRGTDGEHAFLELAWHAYGPRRVPEVPP